LYKTAKLVAGCALLALLVLMLDWRATLTAVVGADQRWVAAALVVSVVGVVLSAEKWRGLLEDSLIRVGLPLAAKLYWIGMFFSNFLPTSVGGDAVRLVLTPAPGRLQFVAGTILIERLTGFVVLLALSGIGLALAPSLYPGEAAGHGLTLLVLVLASATALAITIPAPLGRLLSGLVGRLPALLRRPIAAAQRLTTTLARQVSRRRSVGRALLLSLPFYGTVLLAQYWCLKAVGAQVELGQVLLVGATVQLVGSLPISLNGLGVAEGAFVALYSALGAPPELAFAASLLRRLVDLINSAFGGLVWLSSRKGEAGGGEPSAQHCSAAPAFMPVGGRR